MQGKLTTPGSQHKNEYFQNAFSVSNLLFSRFLPFFRSSSTNCPPAKRTSVILFDGFHGYDCTVGSYQTGITFSLREVHPSALIVVSGLPPLSRSLK